MFKIESGDSYCFTWLYIFKLFKGLRTIQFNPIKAGRVGGGVVFRFLRAMVPRRNNIVPQ